MMLKQKLKIVAATSLTWILFLSVVSACAGMHITTWFVDGRDNLALIRKDSDGHVVSKLTVQQADGYLCYSPVDDEAWRNSLDTYKACCASKN